jgi:predicted ATP-binding protein involved in virulence
MKVKRLKIQSFRGIGDLTLEFDQTEPTVIIGINGVGKSSILDCLAILISQLIGQIEDSPAPIRFFSKEDILIGYETTQNEITVLLESEAFTWLLIGSKDDNYSELQSSLLKLKQQLNRLKDDTNYNFMSQELENLNMRMESIRRSKLDADLNKPVEKLNNMLGMFTEKNIPLSVYYPVNRAVMDMPLKISKVNFKQVDAYKHSLTGGRIDFKSFFEWFRKLEDLENEQRRDNYNYRDKQLEAVRQAISSLIPDFSNLRVERSPLRMTVKKKGEELIVNQLSDGEKCLLAMVGDLARRLAIANPSLTDPLQGYGIVLIDEMYIKKYQ